MAPDRVELHCWEWERGKASHPVYLERAHIFCRFRFGLGIHFLCHFALMIKLREGLLISLCSALLPDCFCGRSLRQKENLSV